jgi:hypothetical protein
MMNRRLSRPQSQLPFWRRESKIPRLACWAFAIGCIWFASHVVGDSVGWTLLAGISALAAIVAVLESGRDLDSSSAAFRTFWLLLSALILPIVFVSGVLLILNPLIDHGLGASFSDPNRGLLCAKQIQLPCGCDLATWSKPMMVSRNNANGAQTVQYATELATMANGRNLECGRITVP